MKLTFSAIVNECNRLALEADKAERSRLIKTKLIRLRTDYEKGIIDDKAYVAGEEEILKDLRSGASI